MPGPDEMTQSAMWRHVDANADTAVRYLDLLSTLMDSIKRRATGELRLAPGQRVLEIGCGTGRDAELMAELVSPGGHVVATDLSAELVAQATARIATLGLALEYRVADAEALTFANDSFDAARVERMLQHTPNPVRAVREMVRVVRPGGRVVAFEPDWETMTAAGGDVAVLRALRSHIADVHHAHGGIGRETPHLFREAGCRDVEAQGVSLGMQSLSLADTVLSLSRGLDGAVAAGAVRAADASRWWEAASALDKAGGFYASLSGTIVSATVG